MDAVKGCSTSGESPPPSPPSKLKIGGAWSGVLEVSLDSWTLPMLRAEVAARSSSAASPDCISLISGGKVLRDAEGHTQSLHDLGLKHNSKLLATVVAPDRGKALNEEADRSQKLTRLRAAALAMAQRHTNGSLPVEDFNMELEDQSGQAVTLGSENDKKGLMMGLMLHQNAKSLMNKQQYKDALDVLSMAEEAFTLCDPKITEMIDNVPMLELDIVWCYFMLRDISCLSVAGVRLGRARKGFQRSHGKDSTRFRLLQEGRQAELAIYLRLELLEGVVAYYSGKFEESRKALNSAHAKYVQLQVSDEALSILMDMGYKERTAKRALRMTGQDIQRAVDFLVEERARKTRRHEENLTRLEEIMEQKTYGRTPQKKAVDIQNLNGLVSIGFERSLAAEALRVSENDVQRALDVLTDPEKNCNLQNNIELRKNKMATSDEALQKLNETASNNENQQAASDPTQDQGEPSGAAAGPTYTERDEAMEDELRKELTGDALADYDIEVTREGEAIAEYLAMLDSEAK